MSHPTGYSVSNNDYELCDFKYSIHFEKIADACGIHGVLVDNPHSLEKILKDCFDIVRIKKQSVLVNVICAQDT